MRNLVIVLGDQLDTDASAFDSFDPATDAVWMAEVAEESTHVWTHQSRIALFLSAMRHFRATLEARGLKVHYRKLDETENKGGLAAELSSAIKRLKPHRLVLTEPGEWRVLELLQKVAIAAAVPLEIREDRHFLSNRLEFEQHAVGRKQLRMEFFYREMRRKHGILMDGDEPVGGQWNFDADNREAFGKSGPPAGPSPIAFKPDRITAEVFKLVETKFARHPGSLKYFDWPVTRADALKALGDFIEHRLPEFGKYQDAMWAEDGLELDADHHRRRAYLFHSRLAAAMNLKLLNPLEINHAAEQAWRKGKVSLASVEGFIRQILGWREYVRGIYWKFMPQYLELNALNASEPLPSFYWTGKTEMNCLRHTINQTMEFGYAHHIQRLMVTGLFSLLLGVDPRKVHEWYLAVYVDAVEWVELPNTLGMSQYGDGGLMTSKPYVASGKYLQRMSNYCDGCRFDPAKSTGKDACPFTTLYWDFLIRHEPMLRKNQRMAMQLKNLNRLDEGARKEIQSQASEVKASCRKG